jgi:hypothetical protein
MAVDNADVVRVAIGPPETHTPLIIHADTVLTHSIPSQLFQPISWWNPKIIKRLCGIYRHELSQHHPAQFRGIPPNCFSGKQSFGVSIREAFDHLE